MIGGSTAAAIVATALIVFALTSGKAPAPSAAPRAVGNSLVGLDPATGRVTSVVPVGVQPTQLIELPDGSMWAYNGTDQTISIIDPSSDRLVQTFGASSLASTTPLASGFGSVWFVRDDETVTRLNPSTHLVERVIKVPHHLNRLATGEDLVWTANGDGTVSMIDPSANTLLRTINIDTSADAIGVGQGAAWITSYNEGTVTKVDAKTGGVTHVDVGGNPTAVEVGFDGVWVLNQGNATVERIAPATLTVTTIPIGRVRALGRGGIAFSATNVWATDPGTGNVVRIDPLTNKARAFHLGFTPVGIAIHGTTVWVTVTLAV